MTKRLNSWVAPFLVVFVLATLFPGSINGQFVCNGIGNCYDCLRVPSTCAWCHGYGCYYTPLQNCPSGQIALGPSQCPTTAVGVVLTAGSIVGIVFGAIIFLCVLCLFCIGCIRSCCDGDVSTSSSSETNQAPLVVEPTSTTEVVTTTTQVPYTPTYTYQPPPPGYTDPQYPYSVPAPQPQYPYTPVGTPVVYAQPPADAQVAYQPPADTHVVPLDPSI